MEPIDRIVFGDNQFFGINHMSQEQARQRGERFRELSAILDVYGFAIDAGIRGFMLNSNERAPSICDHFRKNASSLPELYWYPFLPYPHKYAELVADKGVVGTLRQVLLGQQEASRAIGQIARGIRVLATGNEIEAMKLLIDMEMQAFRGLNVRVVFLQNVITDLMLGLGARRVFEAYCSYVKEKYGVLPGFITQNLPVLKAFLADMGIEEVVLCASFNKIGYLMSPDLESYVETVRDNDPAKYQIMAMSTLASGAIPPQEAYDFINEQNVQSIVFGASSMKNIRETVSLIEHSGERDWAGLDGTRGKARTF